MVQCIDSALEEGYLVLMEEGFWMSMTCMLDLHCYLQDEESKQRCIARDIDVETQRLKQKTTCSTARSNQNPSTWMKTWSSVNEDSVDANPSLVIGLWTRQPLRETAAWISVRS